MAALATCIKKAGKALRDEDREAINARFLALTEAGTSAKEAARMAVAEQIAAVEGMLAAKADGAQEPERVGVAAEPEAAAPTAAPEAKPEVAPMPAVGGISMSLAQQAHAGTSHVPERRAEQERDSFMGALRDAWDRAARIAGTDPAAIERISEVFADVADGYRARYTATLTARSRVMSSMITGAARFPVERNRKRMETERKRAEEASEYLARGIKRLIRAARGPIDNSPESELERVRLNLTQREELQETMKAANAALRKDDDAALEDLGFTAEQIADLKKGSKWERGFPAYRLTNNNAEIRRLRERLESAEARMKDAAAGPVETERQGVRIVEDATDDRLRLIFDGKPSEAVRDDLKANGFKWSPKNDAWQRQLTDNARYAAKVVLDKHYPEGDGQETKFSRAASGRNGVPMPDAEALAEIVRKANPTGPRIILHDDVRKAPKDLLDAIRQEGAENDVEGAYHQGEIHIFPGNIASPDRLLFVMGKHEIRHAGFDAMLGKRKNSILMGIALSNKAVAEAARQKMKDGHASSMVQGVEEALADMPVEELQALQGNSWKRLVAAVRQWLRDLAKRIERAYPNLAAKIRPDEWTDADVAAMVRRAEDVSRRGSGVFGGGETAFAQGADQTQTPEFRRWFGASRVVDSEGRPLVVYHGTRDDIAAFDGGRIKARFPNSEGFYFTSRPSHASAYADSINNAAEDFNPASKFIKPVAEGANVMPAYVSLQNPKIINVSEWGTLESSVDADGGARVRAARAAGHDGVIVKRDANDDWSGVMVIAFRPEQIKSAIGNRGTFDPESSDIRFSRRKPNHTPAQAEALARAGIKAPPSVRQRIAEVFGRALDVLRDRHELAQTFRQGALDQFAGIQRAVTRDLGNLPVEQDPYIAARLANGGTSSVMRALLLHGQARWAANGQHLEKIPDTKGLLDILAPLGEDVHDWFGWMIGNRAARLMKEGRENNFTDDQIKALQALADTPEKKAAFRVASAQYAAFKRSVLDVAEQAGLINPETRKSWDYADYIPFYRQIDEKATFSATGKKGLAGQSSGIRVLKGGESALNDPVENILMNFSRLIDASLKNNAISKTINLLSSAGSEAVKKVGYDMAGAIIPTEQVRKMLEAAGTPDAVMDAIPPEVFEGMAKMWAIQAPTDPDIVRVMVGGKPAFWRVNDPLLLQSLTSFVPFNFPGLGLMRGAKRLLTSLVTSTPEFMVRNFIRDSVAAQAITREGFSPTQSFAGIIKSLRESGAAEQMLFAGASFGSGQVNAGDPTGTAAEVRRSLRSKGMSAAGVDGFMTTLLDTPAKVWEKWRDVTDAVENANREAVYEAATKGGRSATAAAYEAKDLMDFSLRGSWAAYQLLADVLPFFNARVQGLYRLGRSDPKRLAAVGAIILVASLLLAGANDGEDWYEELPDWDKDTYWHFKIGDSHWRIPKPFEIGVIFATIPERIGRSIKGLDAGKKTLGRLWANLRDQLAFDVVPQLARPVLNVWANQDTFRDAPIETMRDEGKLPAQRYDARTSDTTRVLAGAAAPVANATGLSPKRMEYLVNGYLGTVGMYALGLSDMAVRQIEGKPPGPSLRADDLPLVRAFYRTDPARSTVFESDLYNIRQEVDEIYRSVNALRKEGQKDEALKLERKEAAKLSARPLITGAVGQLAALKRQRDAVYADTKMTPEEKRVKLDAIQTQINAVAKQAATNKSVIAAL